MKNFSIRLNEIQMKAIIDSTDLNSRILSGQLGEILLKGILLSKDVNREKIRFLLDELKLEMFPELSIDETYGIYNPKLSENAKIMYDIHQALRYKYSWSKEPKGGFQTWFDDPLRSSAQELPIVEEE